MMERNSAGTDNGRRAVDERSYVRVRRWFVQHVISCPAVRSGLDCRVLSVKGWLLLLMFLGERVYERRREPTGEEGGPGSDGERETSCYVI